jgi:hypothetical protein
MEGTAQVVHPGVGVLPGDEVTAVVMGVDVAWLNQSARGLVVNARMRSLVVWMPGGFSYVTKVRPTGACTTGVRSWAGAQG